VSNAGIWYGGFGHGSPLWGCCFKCRSGVVTSRQVRYWHPNWHPIARHKMILDGIAVGLPPSFSAENEPQAHCMPRHANYDADLVVLRSRIPRLSSGLVFQGPPDGTRPTALT
jgi:hypothetical protein